jgi:HEPN domain-containing protein
MPGVSGDDRARSSLQRAREEHADLEHALGADHTRSKLISQGQRVAEHSLRAILYARHIRIPKTHELHEIAEKRCDALTDIWQELEPLLKHYDWLYPQRLVADYRHADAPPSDGYAGVDEPSVPEENVERALEAAHQFLALAERVVRAYGRPLNSQQSFEP